MPVVTIEMWEGTTDEQKRSMVKGISDAMVQTCGFGPSELHIVIHEIPKNCWAKAGFLAIDPAYSDSSKQPSHKE